MADAFDYIEPFYNRRRRHFTLGDASPQQFLNDWIKRQHMQELAAQCRRVGRRKTEGSSIADFARFRATLMMPDAYRRPVWPTSAGVL